MGKILGKNHSALGAALPEAFFSKLILNRQTLLQGFEILSQHFKTRSRITVICLLSSSWPGTCWLDELEDQKF
jgi:hypothetical protein